MFQEEKLESVKKYTHAKEIPLSYSTTSKHTLNSSESLDNISSCISSAMINSSSTNLISSYCKSTSMIKVKQLDGDFADHSKGSNVHNNKSWLAQSFRKALWKIDNRRKSLSKINNIGATSSTSIKTATNQDAILKIRNNYCDSGINSKRSSLSDDENSSSQINHVIEIDSDSDYEYERVKKLSTVRNKNTALISKRSFRSESELTSKSCKKNNMLFRANNIHVDEPIDENVCPKQTSTSTPPSKSERQEKTPTQFVKLKQQEDSQLNKPNKSPNKWFFDYFIFYVYF